MPRNITLIIKKRQAFHIWVILLKTALRYSRNAAGGKMKVTEVRITLREDGRLLAFANITLDDCFVIRGLKVIDGDEGFFVSMPSRKRQNGSYQDIAHPINNDTRHEIESAVLQAYENSIATPEYN